jgi:hypothetical protein
MISYFEIINLILYSFLHHILGGDNFWFGLFFIKKNNQTDFFKKTKPVQTNRFRFGFLGQKPV